MKKNGTHPPDLSLQELKAFLAVVETGSQSSASRLLGLSQPKVSRSVARVREYFGAELFTTTTGRSPELSGAGADVAKRAREALTLLEQATAPGRTKRPLRIAFSGVARATLVSALKLLDRDIVVLVREATATAFRDLLSRGEVDAAVSFDLNSDREDPSQFKVRRLLAQPLELVVPKSRSKLRNAPLATLLGGLQWCYISPDLLPKYFKATSAWLSSNSIDTPADLTGACRTSSEMFALIGSGRAYGHLPNLCASIAGNDVLFLPVKGIAYESSLNIYFHGDDRQRLTPLLKALQEASNATALERRL